MPDTTFASLIDQVHNASDDASFTVPQDWMQGRTVYGGLVAAMVLKSMRRHVPNQRKIRTLLFTFVGPVNSDPFYIQTQMLRAGKSVTTVESKVIQNDKICSTAVGSFGEDRESKIRIEPDKHPDMTEPAQCLELPYIDGMTPSFTRHFDYRWAEGELPFSGKGGDLIGGWINFREATDCLTEEWLVALSDAWPTPVLAMLTGPAAASTMTWAMEFVHLNRDSCSENEWWAYRCTVDSAEKGYVQERSAVWDPEGALALFSRQTTTVFA